jgi:hypothetical protein
VEGMALMKLITRKYEGAIREMEKLLTMWMEVQI